MISVDSPSPSEAFADDVIDRTAAVDHFEGDMALLHEIAALFLDDCPRRLADLRNACARRDAKALEHAAHSLKGSAANFAADAAVAAAQRLEQMARAGDFTHASEACIALEQEIARLRIALGRL